MKSSPLKAWSRSKYSATGFAKEFLPFSFLPFQSVQLFFLLQKAAGKVKWTGSRRSRQDYILTYSECNEKAFDSARFLAEGALISASAVPNSEKSGDDFEEKRKIKKKKNKMGR